MRLMVMRWFVAGGAALMMTTGCATGPADTGNGPADPGPSRVVRNTGGTGHLIEPGPAAELGYRISWARDMNLPRRQSITSAVILDDLLLTVEAPDNLITARNLRSGEMAWKVKLGSDLERFFTPVRDGGEVYINSETRMFTLRATDGKVLSVADLDEAVNSGPAYSVETGLAIFGSKTGLIFAHSVDNNFARWRYRLPEQISSTPISIDQDVFVVDNAGNYVMLEVTSGDIQWRNHTLGDVSAPPAVQGSEVLVASEDRKLYSLNRTSGNDAWQYLGAEQPLTAPAIPLGRLILLPLTPNRGVVALTAVDGDEVWRTDVNANPVVERDQDLLMHTDNSMFLLDLDDGEVLIEAPTRGIQTVIPGPGESLILISPRGRVLRLSRNAG